MWFIGCVRSAEGERGRAERSDKDTDDQIDGWAAYRYSLQ